MFKLSSAAIAVAFSLSAFTVQAAPPASEATTPAAANPVADISTAISRYDIVSDPNSCGGIPAPKMTPADGYRTLCVNGNLRFLRNDADPYAFKVTVTKTENGKTVARREFNTLQMIGEPTAMSSGDATPYTTGTHTDLATGKTAIETAEVVSGYAFLLDPQSVGEDGRVLVDVFLRHQKLLSLQKMSTGNAPVAEVPSTSVDHLDSTFVLTPGTPTPLHLGDLTIELTASKVAH
jgi:hypothetical protein